MRVYWRPRGSPLGLSLPWWLALPFVLLWLVVVCWIYVAIIALWILWAIIFVGRAGITALVREVRKGG